MKLKVTQCLITLGLGFFLIVQSKISYIYYNDERKVYQMFIKLIKKNLENIIIALFAITLLVIAIFFGGKNIASREAYLKAEVQVRSELLQQRSTTKDLEQWYRDQQ